jgi:hypothetical protein
MGYRVLQFEPKHISQNTEVILWKAQLDPPPNFNSIATVLISDNIAVNNRRPVDEWENLLRDNGFKYEANFENEYTKEYIIFDKECVAFPFQIFACDISVGSYNLELAEEHILPFLYLLDLKKQGTIFPAALLRKINEAKQSLEPSSSPNKVFYGFFRNLESLIDHCQQYEVDIMYSVVEK